MPLDNSVIGQTARDVEPVIRQAVIARGNDTPRELFEWKLYVIRKLHQTAIRDATAIEAAENTATFARFHRA